MKQDCNFINGKWISPENGEIITIINPADKNEKVFETYYADESSAIGALNSADDSQKEWKNTSVAERVEIIRQWLNLLRENSDQIAEAVTRENGKLLHESYAEINASVKEGDYQIDFISKNLTENINGHQISYEPLGVTLLITPWNFPVATVLRKLLPALLTGNTAVVKASEFTPFSSYKLFQLLDKTDMPAGVVNLIVGLGNILVPPLIKSGIIKTVSFTGSVPNGQLIAREIDPVHTRYQAELGGNNTVVVLKDADLEKAADAVIGNGFACSGQWCTGTGRIIAERDIYDQLIKLLLERIRNIKLGSGLDPSVNMGPLITELQLQRMEAAVTKAKNEGAEILCGGKRADDKNLINGNFFEPTLIGGLTREMETADTEIFGPVISIIKVKDPVEALEISKSSGFGLAFSVYTDDKQKAEYFINRIESGVCHVNMPTTFRDVALPLSGWKNSGIGLPESGRFMRDFFTRTKAIYRD